MRVPEVIVPRAEREGYPVTAVGRSIAATATCPGEMALVAFVDGQVVGSQRGLLERHIDACSACADLVFALADGLAATESSLPTLCATAGRYVVGSVIGAGGMGVVREGYDPLLDRRIAIKLIRPRPVDDVEARSDTSATTRAGTTAVVDRGRLRDEAHALARLAHPHIVEVFDVGVGAGGVYIAMELVVGCSLRSWADGAMRAWTDVLAMYLPAAEALAAAHEVGLVHADFKPDNVLVSTTGRVKVVDFGLARAITDASAGAHDGSAAPSEPTGIWGTPAYLAPECWTRREREPAADQFAFFVSLYEALWSRRPFGADARNVNALRASIHDGIGEPPRDAHVPVDLRRVIQRGLAVDPRERYPTMRAAIDALRRVARQHRTHGLRRSVFALVITVGGLLAGLFAIRGLLATHARERVQTLCARDVESVASLWDSAARERTRDSMVAAHPTLGATTFDRLTPWVDGYVAELQSGYRDACARGSPASEAELDARARGCLAERRQALETALDVLGDADRDAVIAAVQSVATLPDVAACSDDAGLATHEVLPADRDLGERISAAQRDVVVSDQLGIGGRSAAGLEAAEEALAEAKHLGWMPLVARAHLAVGMRLAELGRFGDAEASLREAFFLARASGADEDAGRAATRLASVVGRHLARVDEGLQWCRHAEAAEPEVAARRSERVAARDSTCASVFLRKGKTEEALRLARNVRAIRVDLFGETHPLVASSDVLLGVAHTSVDQGPEALAYYDRARSVFEQTMGPDHPTVATTYANMAAVNLRMGRYVEARPQGERALAIRERVLPADHPDLATSLTTMGWVYLQLDDRVAAERSFRRALDIREHTLGRDHPDVAGVLGNLSVSLRLRGACDEALEAATRALAIVQVRSEGDADVLWAELNLADARVTCGRPREALADFAGALPAAERAGDARRRERIRALRGIGEASLALGDVAGARAPLERALELQLAIEDDSQGLAKTLYLLAKALASTSSERERSIGLGLAAHFVALSDRVRGEESVQEIGDWLAATARAKP